MMAILCGTSSIRDVIAFPKTGAGTDALFGSPAPAGEHALKEYHVRALKNVEGKPAESTHQAGKLE
jgi:aspartyl-tRNA synthetase